MTVVYAENTCVKQHSNSQTIS